MERREIFPAQSEIQCEIRFYFEIVLNEKRVDIRANVFRCRRGQAIPWIEVTALRVRGVVGKIPQVSKTILRPRRPGFRVVVLLPIEVGAKLKRMSADLR